MFSSELRGQTQEPVSQTVETGQTFPDCFVLRVWVGIVPMSEQRELIVRD